MLSPCVAGIERIELGISGQLFSAQNIHREREKASHREWKKEEKKVSREAETKDKEGRSPCYNGSLIAFQPLLPCP